jgi:hypothetical protein
MFFRPDNMKQGEYSLCDEFICPNPEGDQISSSEGPVHTFTPNRAAGPNGTTGPNEIGPQGAENNTHQPQIIQESTQHLNLRRSSRTTQQSTRLNDFITYSVKYPIEEQVRYNKISKNFRTFLTCIEKPSEPISFEEASKSEIWVKAMREEINAMNKNHTWDIVPLPIGKKPVGCR